MNRPLLDILSTWLKIKSDSDVINMFTMLNMALWLIINICMHPWCHCRAVWIISLVACVLGIKQPALNGEFSFKNWDLKGSIKLKQFYELFYYKYSTRISCKLQVSSYYYNSISMNYWSALRKVYKTTFIDATCNNYLYPVTFDYSMFLISLTLLTIINVLRRMTPKLWKFG